MEGRRRALGLVAALVIASACAADLPTTTTTPPPATAAEMNVFCERWADFKDEDIRTMLNALIDVAPAEIKGVIVRMAGPPSDGWDEDDAQFDDFVKRCET